MVVLQSSRVSFSSDRVRYRLISCFFIDIYSCLLMRWLLVLFVSFALLQTNLMMSDSCRKRKPEFCWQAVCCSWLLHARVLEIRSTDAFCSVILCCSQTSVFLYFYHRFRFAVCSAEYFQPSRSARLRFTLSPSRWPQT